MSTHQPVSCSYVLAKHLVGKTEYKALWDSALLALEEARPGVVFVAFERRDARLYRVHTTAPVSFAAARELLVPHAPRASLEMNPATDVLPPAQVRTYARKDSEGTVLLVAAWALPGAHPLSSDDLQEVVELLADALVVVREVEALRIETQVDALTGLFNRRAVLEALGREQDRAKRYDHELAVLYVDVDRFKQVNDTYGHAVGDEALQLVAETLRRAVRSSDIVGRIGGDEFLVVLPETPRRFAEALRHRVERMLAGQTLQAGTESVRLSVTVGTASRAGDQDLVALADQRMLTQKRRGRANAWRAAS